MAAIAETETAQKDEGFDLKCMHKTRKEHSLGEHGYLVKCNGEARLYCKKCAEKVTTEGLEKYEAKEVETLLSDLAFTFKERVPLMCHKCKKEKKQTPVSHRLERDGTVDWICEEHGRTMKSKKGGELKKLDEKGDEGTVKVTKISLLTRQANGSCGESCIVVKFDDLPKLTINLERLKVPVVEDKKNYLAVVLKEVLDKAVSWFKEHFDPTNRTNAFHFRTLLSAIYQLEVLIRHPQKCCMLKDYGTTSRFALEVEPMLFTVGNGRHVSITVTEDLENCKQYLSAPGFIITVTKVEKIDNRLEVTFDLKPDELTRLAARMGVQTGAFQIGYTNTETGMSFAREAVATTST